MNNVTANYVWKEKNIKFIQYEQASTFQTIDFEHDAYGKRTKKIYTYYHSKYEQGLEDVFTHNYDYDTNGRLIRETISTVYYGQQSPINDELIYLYDGNDVVGMIHTNNDVSNTYTFDKNYKGDVIGIYDSTGTIIARYAYDAWGKCTILNGSNMTIANINPFRYRSYYFDSESGLYYLNARYYDPSWRIFISPDSPEYLDPETPSGLNLNAYCYNDPINISNTPSLLSKYISDAKMSSASPLISVSRPNDIYKGPILPKVPGWVGKLSTGLDHGFSMINPIRSALACLQYTDLWDLMRLDGITELPGVLSKVATGVGWGLSIAGGVIAGYEKHASGASISSSIAGGLINTGISIGGMYLSTAVASYAMGALAASSLAIPGAVIVVGGAIIAIGTGMAINQLLTNLTIGGNTIEGYLNDFVDWLIFWD